MNLAELNVVKGALRDALANYERIKPCCHSCTNYSGNLDSGRCAKFDNAQPPKEWIRGPVECEQWTYDAIPF